ncbi:glutamate racemase [Ligilactobacillus sp. WILCCON 0076]|uniref:Glutamate racemase n=1 Tax=Ligilactobacillus ubinensis TaxID=2876789 RepID=A0A9X2FLQ6_9LACO|nr:glutamate racemase [Ligilactobacillus ubinensis]MCP0887675.1 glutamate racemase [Ligilactobacillus ubinensis]
MDLQFRNKAIGIFDSGLGGISVLKEAVKLMPNEDFIFFGDSKNAPYGVKSVEQVYALSNAIVDKFLKEKVKAIVIACNTATSAAAKRLRLEHPEIPIIGLEPALKPAVLNKPNSRIVVMATPLTLKEEKFANLMQRFESQAHIIKLPAPDLVEYVEKGQLDTPEVKEYLRTILAPYIDKTDAIVLGCTHFPFAKETIQDIMGTKVTIFDGGAGAARELQHLLEENKTRRTDDAIGKIKFTNSLDTAEEIALSKKLFSL